MAVQSVKLTTIKVAVKSTANITSDQQDLSWSKSKTLESVALLPFPQDVNISTAPSWSAVAGGIIGEKLLEARISDVGSALAFAKNTASDTAVIDASFDSAGRSILDAAGTGAGVAGAAKFNDASKGLALNNREVMLFNGISHRSFSITFNLSPNNVDQSYSIAKFIRELHYNATPDVDGSYFKYPATFGFALIGDDNKVILDRGEVAITGISCNYTPDSIWATFNNNQPVHIVLTLDFQELELPTRGTIDRTFGNGVR